jgi:urease gamma subunit
MLPCHFGHVLEIHAIDRGNEGRGQEQHRGHGKDPDHAVLLHVHDAEEGVLQELEPLEVEAAVVDQRFDVLVHDPQGVHVVARKQVRPLQSADYPLFLSDVLAQCDGPLLQVCHFDEQLAVGHTLLGKPRVDDRNAVGHMLDQIRIDVNAGFEDGNQDFVAGGGASDSEARNRVIKRTVRPVPLGIEFAAAQLEGHGFGPVGGPFRPNEIQVDADFVWIFEKARTRFDFSAVRSRKQLYAAHRLYLPNLGVRSLQQIDPDRIVPNFRGAGGVSDQTPVYRAVGRDHGLLRFRAERPLVGRSHLFDVRTIDRIDACEDGLEV